MPDTELEELDLGEAFSKGFLNPGAAVTFQPELTTSSEIGARAPARGFGTFCPVVLSPTYQRSRSRQRLSA